MPEGFFKTSELTSKPPIASLPQCGKCGLSKLCESPKMPVDGNGERKILIVGEGPGTTEDQRNQPFVGKTGRLLQERLSLHGIDLRKDCWITNAVICRPSTKGRHRTPTSKEIEFCRPNVVNTIKKLKPEVIVLLGKSALDSLIPYVWKESVDGLSRWLGWTIPCQKINAWICPTWHPSFVVRSQDDRDAEMVNFLFNKHLKQVSELKERPWKIVPNFRQQVQVVLDDKEAATLLKKEFFTDKPFAFDYETTTLKPDGGKAEILCCSASNGKVTISFPWYGKAERMMMELLKSDTPKVGQNAKFEDRWTRKVLGFEVNNWYWDTMLVAHLLDNRSKITSLKFQAFIHLGQDSYDEVVKPYMQADGGNELNRLKEVDRKTILTYCGLDSLLEYKLYQIQRKEMEKHGTR